MDKVRVLRIVQYTGPRDQVEDQVKRAIHGERLVGKVVICAVTVDEYPKILDVPSCDLPTGATGKTWRGP